MKLEELFEMSPVFIDKEMPIITGATINFYSETTLNEVFDPVSKDVVDNKTYFTVIAKDKSKVVLGEIGLRREDKTPGIFIKVQMDLKDKPDFSYDRMIKVPGHVIQEDAIEVVGGDTRRGFGFMLYLALIKAGYVVVSDYIHYRGGKAIWKKLARFMKVNNYSVYVVDNGHPKLDTDGEPVAYDGSNIDDAEIWSTHPDTNKYHVLLVAKKNQ